MYVNLAQYFSCLTDVSQYKYSQTSVYELNSFLKVVRKLKCS
jgi:hypothetical protein